MRGHIIQSMLQIIFHWCYNILDRGRNCIYLQKMLQKYFTNDLSSLPYTYWNSSWFSFIYTSLLVLTFSTAKWWEFIINFKTARIFFLSDSNKICLLTTPQIFSFKPHEKYCARLFIIFCHEFHIIQSVYHMTPPPLIPITSRTFWQKNVLLPQK